MPGHITATRPTRAVVVGGGWTGLLATTVLARHLDHVTVVERDKLPDGPQHRRGLPQAHHTHLFWSGGVRIVEALLPGTRDRLAAVGATEVGVHRDLITLTPHGWQHRFPGDEFAITCSRPLLDWVVRKRVLSAPTTPERITVLQATEAVGLDGDNTRVRGVRVRDINSSATSSLAADLVVDASGRGSRLGSWLAGLGSAPVASDIVDIGMLYATRVFRAPKQATTHFPAVNVLGDYREKRPSCNGFVSPIERGRWMVTLSGTRGADVPTDDAEFAMFARRLRHPIIADLIATAEPLTSVVNSRTGINRRLYPEQLATWPDGLLVLGDALAAFNPIYGHGLSAAAHGVAALDDRLRRADDSAGWSTIGAQRAISEAVDDPWIMATSRDVRYVNCRTHADDPRLTGTSAAALREFTDIVASKTLRSAAVSKIVTRVTSLSVPQAALGTSDFFALLQREELLPALSEPPLRSDELAIVNRGGHRTVTAGGPGVGPRVCTA